jgi:hypothetical protein
LVRRTVGSIGRAIGEGSRGTAWLRSRPDLASLGDARKFRVIAAFVDDRAFPAEPSATRP